MHVDQAALERVGPRSEGPGGGRGNRILHLPIVVAEEGASAPGRTDIYEKIGQFLKLPSGELSRLADVQRQLELKKKVAEPPAPLFGDCRNLILRKCAPERQAEIQRIFEKEAFGELARLITQRSWR